MRYRVAHKRNSISRSNQSMYYFVYYIFYKYTNDNIFDDFQNFQQLSKIFRTFSKDCKRSENDIFTYEDMIPSYVMISCCFYQFDTTQYFTDVYMIKKDNESLLQILFKCTGRLKI